VIFIKTKLVASFRAATLCVTSALVVLTILIVILIVASPFVSPQSFSIFGEQLSLGIVLIGSALLFFTAPVAFSSTELTTPILTDAQDSLYEFTKAYPVCVAALGGCGVAFFA